MPVPYDEQTASTQDRIAWALCQIIDDDAPLHWTRYRAAAEPIALNEDLMADLKALAVERTPPLEAAFDGQFMQPDIYEGHYFEVETTSGTWIVPSDLIGDLTDVKVERLLTYIEGEPLDPDTTLNAQDGWLARLSAPGYMDCTDWTAHETLQEATDYLIKTYGN